MPQNGRSVPCSSSTRHSSSSRLATRACSCSGLGGLRSKPAFERRLSSTGEWAMGLPLKCMEEPLHRNRIQRLRLLDHVPVMGRSERGGSLVGLPAQTHDHAQGSMRGKAMPGTEGQTFVDGGDFVLAPCLLRRN